MADHISSARIGMSSSLQVDTCASSTAQSSSCTSTASPPFSQPFTTSKFSTPPSSPRVSEYSETCKTSKNALNGLYTPPYTPKSSPQEAKFGNDGITFIRSLLNGDEESNILRFIPPLGETLQLGDVCGEGQWSTVYMARLDGSIATLKSERIPTVVAVKVGNGKLSEEVIKHEARILTHLSRDSCSQDFLVRFYGYDTSAKGLVLEFCNISLERYTDFTADQPWTTDMSGEIQSIASQLVRGLDFLHGKSVIHGDIKPANVLLRPLILDSTQSKEPKISIKACTNIKYRALYCDFSASRYDRPDSFPDGSAQTYDYMAPELFTTKKPQCFPTLMSDVYALGVTLLYAIIGQSPYASGQSGTVRRIMATQGKPLEFIFRDWEASERLKTSGMEPFLSAAVVTTPSMRCSAAQWAQFSEAL